MSKKTKRIISIVICVLLALSMVLGIVIPAFADDLDDLYTEEDQLQQEEAEQQLLLDATEEELAAAQAAVDACVEEIAELDEQMAEIGGRIAELDTKIAVNQELLDTTNQQLEDQKAELKEYYGHFKNRIQMMYETNATNYLEVILSASSISDLFSRLEYISEVVKYDNEIIAEMNRVEAAIAASKETIEQTETALEQDRAQEETERANLQLVLDEKNADLEELNENELAVALMKQQQEEAMAEIQGRLASTQEAIANAEWALNEASRLAEESRQAEASRRAEEERKRAEEASRKAEEASRTEDEDEDEPTSENEDEDEEESEVEDPPEPGYASDADSRALSYGWESWPGIGNGYCYWPVDCYLVSSLYGPRVHPITGEYSNHGGLDIAASYGQPIYAAHSGYVVDSCDGWNGGWGNYIEIDHGDGVQTLYAHQSERVVEVGEYVEAGQVIGYVGSTGMSTGPHLHFEVYVGGGRVNPEDWL